MFHCLIRHLISITQPPSCHLLLLGTDKATYPVVIGRFSTSTVSEVLSWGFKIISPNYLVITLVFLEDMKTEDAKDGQSL